jgi:hypothetical protein
VSACDLRRNVLLWTVHRCHQVDGREASLEGERRNEDSRGLEMESVDGGGLVLYTITAVGLVVKGST